MFDMINGFASRWAWYFQESAEPQSQPCICVCSFAAVQRVAIERLQELEFYDLVKIGQCI